MITTVIGMAHIERRTCQRSHSCWQIHTLTFSKYDNDHDGIVETVMIVHQGKGSRRKAEISAIFGHIQWYLSIKLG